MRVRIVWALAAGAALAAVASTPLAAQLKPSAGGARQARLVEELAVLKVGKKVTPLELPDSLVHNQPITLRFFSHVDGCWGGAGETKVKRKATVIELRAYDKRRPVAAGEKCPVQAQDAEHKVSLMITAPGTYTLYLLGRSDTQARKDFADVRIEKQLVVR